MFEPAVSLYAGLRNSLILHAMCYLYMASGSKAPRKRYDSNVLPSLPIVKMTSLLSFKPWLPKHLSFHEPPCGSVNSGLLERTIFIVRSSYH